MTPKMEFYSNLAAETTERVTREWPSFLEISGRMYKYPFHDQLMIYAQRPDATACASFDLWNNDLNRKVKRGSKGIALIDDSGDSLRYVFDVSDTYGINKNIPLWAFKQEHEEPVLKALADTYGDLEGNLSNAIDRIARKLADEYFEKHQNDIKEAIPYVTEWEFCEIAAASTAYAIRSRCGLDADFPGDLQLSELTPESTRALGNTVSILSEQVLRGIEISVKQYEYERKQHERRTSQTDISKSGQRGLFDSQPDVAGRKTAEYVRQDAQGLSEKPPSDNIQRTASYRETEQPSLGNQPDGGRTYGAIDGRIDKERSAPRQSNKSDGLGRTHEQPARTGQGNRSRGTGLQLTLFDAEPVNTVSTSAPVTAVSAHEETAGNRLFEKTPTPATGVSADAAPETIENTRGDDEPHIPVPGDRYKIQGRMFEVDAVYANNVSLRDVTFQNGTGFPIFRSESIELLQMYTPVLRAQPEHETQAEPVTTETVKQYELGYGYMGNGLSVWNRLEEKDGEYVTVAHISPEREITFYDGALPEAVKTKILETAKTAEITVQDARVLTAPVLRDSIAKTGLVTEPEAPPPAKVTSAETSAAKVVFTDPKYDRPQVENFRITDFHLGEGGAKTKYGFNTEAIRTLKQIETENRHATPEEQTILSKYVGWGGLPQAFDGENSQWAKEYAELKDLLSANEYESARSSTLNAHYTSPVVIQAMYETIERMGFTKGNILEPACGVGNFIGMLPDSMKDSKVYGVELDSITGRIAQKLYPNANIQVKGFEKTEMPDATFDLAIGNVPFGDYGVADRRYDRHRFHIHDYFFAKTLDQVRPGGIVAFITSQGTMDKQSSDVRRYIAQRAELLGAVRLPYNAFKANAGTDVTVDIIFLQKRERQIDIANDAAGWIHRGELENGIPVNSYFAKNPEMILGRMAWGNKLYGDQSRSTSCHPIEGADLAEQLREALSRIEGFITEPEFDADTPDAVDKSLPADPGVRNFSYTVIDNTVYFRENSRMNPVETSAVALERIKGMVALRDCTRELIDYQLDGRSNEAIQAKQAELTKRYDSFTEKHGLINSTANKRAFNEDSTYYLLASLEIIDENGELAKKADMFTKRTIAARSVVTAVDTSSEALAVSIAEKAFVDLPYMASLTGFTEAKIASDLKGVIFQDADLLTDSDKWRWVTVDEYLSGNVRDKLRTVKTFAETRPEQAAMVAPNIAALEQAQPKDLDASEISVRLGSTWIDRKYVEQFVDELLEYPYHYKPYVNYCAHSGEWNVERLNSANRILTGVTYGTGKMDAFRIIEETLNLRDVRVYDTKTNSDGNKITEINKAETTKAQQKQETIKQAFKDWIFNDPERRQELVKTYNEKFNSTRPREYDGQHLNFVGKNPEISLRPHQLNAVAHILYGGNTLLAHEVGAGKTFEMVAAAMEAKRLGLCRKSLFAVPNHLTEQWGSEFLRLYPSANILVATAKDFETGNRKKFCARIATGDYDAVIIGHSQMEKIPISEERQARFLRDQVEDIAIGIAELKEADAPRFSIKQLEKTKKTLEARLERLFDEGRKDNVVTFEQLGCDRLFVDEAHSFKNLFLYTKMRNVAGITQTEAQKSSDLFLKCRYLDEITGGKGIIFATGTPVSNSMTEMYTMQRYLQYDALERHGLIHFDSWASTFGETVTAIELAPEGTGYRARTRFARFHNLPEIMSMFKDVADIKTADMMNLPRPKAHFHTVVVEPSDIQREMVAALSERAAAVHAKLVEPYEDNMLKITSDGRKIGLDQRLANALLPDFPGSKVNACTDNIFKIWKETESDKLTQLVFCDFSTPNADGRFNVYDDIRGKLIARGVPEKEMAFIHDAKTEAKKKDLFEKVRRGDVRILFGSTFKMGSGTNVQDRLIHLHDLDCPWRPADLEQRAGRIVRQGNMNPEVHITRYVTEGTFDAYLYQTIENKQRFISQIMTSKSPVRSCEDVDEAALSYAEIKALCAGNPLIREKMDLDIEVARLRLLKADYQSQRYKLEDAILKTYPKTIEAAKERIAGYRDDQERLKAGTAPNEDGFSPMKIAGVVHTEKALAGQALIDMCKTVTGKEPVKIGTYRGFDMYLSFCPVLQSYEATLKGAMSHSTVLGTDVHGNITRLNNLLGKLPERLDEVRHGLDDTQKQLETAKEEIKKPFQFEAVLAAKSQRLAELDSQLNMDNTPSQSEPAVPEAETEAENEPEDDLEYIAKEDEWGTDYVDDQNMNEISRATDEIDSYAAVAQDSKCDGMDDSINSESLIGKTAENTGENELEIIAKIDPSRIIVGTIPNYNQDGMDR